MKQSQALFNRDLYELDYKYLQEFFSVAQEENLYLEFKSYSEKGSYGPKEDAIKKGALKWEVVYDDTCYCDIFVCICVINLVFFLSENSTGCQVFSHSCR